MKKLFVFLSVCAFTFGVSSALVSCIPSSAGDNKKKVAMITDLGDVDDRSFNEGTWQGVLDYFKGTNSQRGKDYKYFKPVSQAPTDYLASIDDAITWGAKAVICPGFLFETPVYEAQFLYPDVVFMIEDGTPHPLNDFTHPYINDNTISIYFKEHESGFLAGYSAVLEGNKKLGFMGGMSVPAVKKFGAGYVAGAYYAAKKVGLTDVTIDDQFYHYLGTFIPSMNIKSKSAAWYQNDLDIIFAAAGGAGSSIMAAAEEAGKMMIGVDVDQSYMSKSVLTSAKKNLSKAVEIFLDRFFSTWQGGETLYLGTEIDGVSLPTEVRDGIDPWRFQRFSKEQYYSLYASIKNKEVIIPSDYNELKVFVESLGFELKISKETFDDTK